MKNRLREQLDQAAHHLEDGAFAKTLRTLESTEIESLLSTDFWYLRGFAQRGLEDFKEAASSFATVLTVKPGEVAAHALAADSYIRCWRLGAAEEQLLGGLATRPNSKDLIEVYCFACARGGQTEKARALLARLLERDPDNNATFRLRILIEFVEGSNTGLYEANRRYLEDLPDGAENALAAGKALLDSGRIAGAVRCFREALRQDPSLGEEHPEFFEEIEVLESPFLLPNRLVDRYGRGLPWAAGLVTLLLLRSFHGGVGLTFAGAFALFLAYTWVAPPLVRRFKRGRR